ncbi:MAG TPA: T9SS type A sorting domain-containing protein, partial [Saprospiraceae bacterium]|nr:T9SS type A sorting domain-containing protein [Saprospiraceae bacterium]
EGAKDTDEVKVFVLDKLSTHTGDVSSAIYPNPAKGGIFHINPGAKLKPGTSARIFDIDGREMMRFVVGREDSSFQCNQCVSGVFVIRFDNGMSAALVVMP